MFDIDTKIHEPSEGVTVALEACIKEADALIKSLNDMKEGLKLTPSDFEGVRLKDSSKERIYTYRQQLLGIPASLSRESLLSDRSIMAMVVGLRADCETELVFAQKIKNKFQSNPYTVYNLTVAYLQTRRYQTLYYGKIDVTIKQEMQAQKKSVTQACYARMFTQQLNMNFFDTVLTLTEPHLNALYKAFDSSVKYKVKDISKDPDVIELTEVLEGIDLGWIMKPLTLLHNNFLAFYEELKLGMKYIPSDAAAKVDLDKLESSNDISEILAKAEKLQGLKECEAGDGVRLSTDVLQFLVSAMMKCNDLANILPAVMKSITVSKVYIKTIEKQKALALANTNVQELGNNVPLETASVPEPVVEEPDPVIEEPALVFDQPASTKRTKTFAYQPVPEQVEHPKIKLKTVKKLDREVLKMFFTMPVPNLTMTEKQLFKFMEALGAKVEDGKGSAVKISFDPKTLSYDASEGLRKGSMSMHKLHSNGHNEKCILSDVIKYACRFFEQTGLYDLLKAELDNEHKETQALVMKH